MTVSQEQVHQLMDTIEDLRGEMASHRRLLIKTDQRSRLARIIGVIGVIVACVGIAVGGVGVWVGRNARNAATDIVATRNENRVSSCQQSNVVTLEVQSSLIAGVQLLHAVADARNVNVVDDFIASYSKTVKDDLPFRDCTPKGIAAYLNNPPSDPGAATNP